ncbi:sulfurtransferase TusA family protein [Stutzerimonas xanthomarina]
MELKRLEVGQVLLIISTDTGTKRDFHSFVAATTHKLIKEEDDGSGTYRFWLEVGARS